MVTKFSTSFIEIAIDAQKKCLVQAWNGYCSSEEFRLGQYKSLELFKENGCHHFISDTTNACPLPEEEVQWVSINITPKLIEAGLEILNLVVPSNVYTRLTLEVLEKTDRDINNIPMRFFGSLENALESIEVVKKKKEDN
jgi:hypothetical protein